MLACTSELSFCASIVNCSSRSLVAGGRNLSDKLYVFEEGFPEPGRTWFVNLNAVF